ncbi:hypothetical protein F4802DRAFT_560553 [Xylaria palmicola]|nr:hypothetical protein F4802DRAFT_560553 [Xylaria palmicola]
MVPGEVSNDTPFVFRGGMSPATSPSGLDSDAQVAGRPGPSTTRLSRRLSLRAWLGGSPSLLSASARACGLMTCAICRWISSAAASIALSGSGAPDSYPVPWRRRYSASSALARLTVGSRFLSCSSSDAVRASPLVACSHMKSVDMAFTVTAAIWTLRRRSLMSGLSRRYLILSRRLPRAVVFPFASPAKRSTRYAILSHTYAHCFCTPQTRLSRLLCSLLPTPPPCAGAGRSASSANKFSRPVKLVVSIRKACISSGALRIALRWCRRLVVSVTNSPVSWETAATGPIIAGGSVIF